MAARVAIKQSRRTLIRAVSDGRLREVAVLIVAKLGTDAYGVVRVRLQTADFVHGVRPDLNTIIIIITVVKFTPRNLAIANRSRDSCAHKVITVSKLPKMTSNSNSNSN